MTKLDFSIQLSPRRHTELTNPKGLGISDLGHLGIPKLAKIGKPNCFYSIPSLISYGYYVFDGRSVSGNCVNLPNLLK